MLYKIAIPLWHFIILYLDKLPSCCGSQIFDHGILQAIMGKFCMDVLNSIMCQENNLNMGMDKQKKISLLYSQ